MARIVIEGLSLAQRDQLLGHVRATKALLADVELALVAGRHEPKPERPAPIPGSRPITYIGKLPTVRWREVVDAVRSGDLEEYVCLQKTGSAHANRSTLLRRYDFLSVDVQNNRDGTATMTLRLKRTAEEVAL